MSIEVNGLFPGKIHPSNTIAGCIDIFENVWPDPDSTINEIEKECINPESGINWEKANIIGEEYSQTYRTNFHLGITNSARNGNVAAQNIHNQVYMTLLAASIPYLSKHDLPNMAHEPYNFLKYNSNQYYDRHTDSDISYPRTVSAIIYLNNNYSGGELEFVNFNIKIKPEPGMLILFPSNYAYSHIAHPLKSGTKYAIVTWMREL